MSDIFLSYKREEQSAARTLADALEKQGWSVWWDPKLRTGERFDDVIEAGLKESKCVVLMWSKLSVNSSYVKDEASYALNRKKLVPVRIQEVELPFRFETLHTPELLGWNGAEDFVEFRRLVDDISVIVRPPAINRQRNDLRSNQRAPRRKNADTPRSTSQELARRVAVPAEGKLFEPGKVFQDSLQDNSRGPEMVVVPAGEFQMGDIQGNGFDAERPVHTVRIQKPFAIGKYPVTFEEYDKFISTTGQKFPQDEGWGRGRQPAINVSWLDAVKFSEWLSKEAHKLYRLPTEAEWEYIARAGTVTTYWWGNKLKADMANYRGGDNRWGGKQTSPVGSFQPNAFGLCDTAGNVWEWVQDPWHENYIGAPSDGSAWESSDIGQPVIRGGAWSGRPVYLRSSFRNRSDADYRNGGVGFRLAQDIE